MRRSKGPRLYLAKTQDRPATWVIRDGAKFVRTGALEDEEVKAGQVLTDYLQLTGRVAGMKADLMHPRPAATMPSLIYFVTCEAPDFPIKIGAASNVNLRIRQLQGALPFPIVLIGHIPGMIADEHRLHRRFTHLRMQGEWFRRDAELIQYIREVCFNYTEMPHEQRQRTAGRSGRDDPEPEKAVRRDRHDHRHAQDAVARDGACAGVVGEVGARADSQRGPAIVGKWPSGMER